MMQQLLHAYAKVRANDLQELSAWLSVLLSMLEPRISLPRGWEFLFPVCLGTRMRAQRLFWLRILTLQLQEKVVKCALTLLFLSLFVGQGRA